MGIYRIAGIIFQKESRRGQTLSWWREGGGERGRRGWRVTREAGRLAGWLAGSTVALVLIHNPCRPPSRRRATEVEKERGTVGCDRGRKDRSQPLNIGVEHLDVAMSEIIAQ